MPTASLSATITISAECKRHFCFWQLNPTLYPTNHGKKLPGMEMFPKNSLREKINPVKISYLPGLRKEGSRERHGWQEAWLGLHGVQNLGAQG